MTLVEARLKRHHFQRAACRTLGITNANAVRGRIEDLEPSLHEAVVAQALARPATALAWMAPWIAPGGLAILPGGVAEPRAEHPGIQAERAIRYRVPCGGPERTLWIGRSVRT